MQKKNYSVNKTIGKWTVSIFADLDQQPQLHCAYTLAWTAGLWRTVQTDQVLLETDDSGSRNKISSTTYKHQRWVQTLWVLPWYYVTVTSGGNKYSTVLYCYCTVQYSTVQYNPGISIAPPTSRPVAHYREMTTTTTKTMTMMMMMTMMMTMTALKRQFKCTAAKTQNRM